MEIVVVGTGIYRERGTEEIELGAGLDRFTIVDESTEELDIDARNKTHAREIARVAWSRDYEGELSIIEVIGPRFGLYL